MDRILTNENICNQLRKVQREETTKTQGPWYLERVEEQESVRVEEILDYL